MGLPQCSVSFSSLMSLTFLCAFTRIISHSFHILTPFNSSDNAAAPCNSWQHR
jgi:hypothetical protein